MQKIIFTGNLSRDVETRETANGKTVANFSVAVKRPYSKDNTDFFDVVAFDKLGENCARYLSKGSKVLVDGYVSTRTYEKEGVKRKVFEVICDNVEFLSRNN